MPCSPAARWRSSSCSGGSASRRSSVEAQITVLRQERYSILRGRKLSRKVIAELEVVLTQGTTEAVVLFHHSPAVGKTMWETGLLDEKAVTLVALVRGGHAMTDFDPQPELRVGDTLVLTGIHAPLHKVIDRLSPPPPG